MFYTLFWNGMGHSVGNILNAEPLFVTTCSYNILEYWNISLQSCSLDSSPQEGGVPQHRTFKDLYHVSHLSQNHKLLFTAQYDSADR